MGQVRHMNNDLQIRKGGVGVPWQSPSSQLQCSSTFPILGDIIWTYKLLYNIKELYLPKRKH